MSVRRAAPLLRYTPEVGEALLRKGPVVALESSVLAQGLPIPANREAAEAMQRAVQQHGAMAAITAVVAGEPSIGLTSEELQRFLAREGIAKVSARDLAVAMLRGSDGATTVAAALVLCRDAGLPVFATGGVGGVHRESPFDESADLIELSRTPMIVVCAGAKSVLDLPATLERFESLGVTLVGYGTDECPGFFTAHTGLRVSARADNVADIVRLFEIERRLQRPTALVVAVPPPAGFALDRAEVDAAVDRALHEARAQRITGAAVTPFLLAALERATAGRTLRTNVALLANNAALAAQIAVALAQR